MTLEEIKNDDSLTVVEEVNEKVRHQFYWMAERVEELEKELAAEKQNYVEAFVDAEKYDSQTEEIDRLRAELDKQTVKLANKSASVDGLLEKWRDAEKENGELRAELAAEREKREYSPCFSLKWFGYPVEADNGGKIIGPPDNLEAQVEALRDSLEWLVKLKDIKDLGKTASYKRNKEKAWEKARDTLANIPARAEKVKAVLDAAEEFEQAYEHWSAGRQVSAIGTLLEAVRERREE